MTRQWLHDLEYEDAALAAALERSRVPGRMSASEKAVLRNWRKTFEAELAAWRRTLP